MITISELSRSRSKRICLPSGSVEGAHRVAVGQMRKLTRGHSGQVETPEVLRAQLALHVNQAAITGEANALAIPAKPDRRQSDGSPSGRTASSGVNAETFGPANAMRVPSGDHTGLIAPPVVKRIGLPPSTGTKNSPRAPFSLARTTTDGAPFRRPRGGAADVQRLRQGPQLTAVGRQHMQLEPTILARSMSFRSASSVSGTGTSGHVEGPRLAMFPLCPAALHPESHRGRRIRRFVPGSPED